MHRCVYGDGNFRKPITLWDLGLSDSVICLTILMTFEVLTDADVRLRGFLFRLSQTLANPRLFLSTLEIIPVEKKYQSEIVSES